MSRSILIVACCIAAIRAMAPFEVDVDQAVQLEAAERLVAGQGLTSTYFGAHPLDLVEPAVAEHLTWFPPGFSLIVAAFLAMGVPLTVALRVIYASATVTGWIGWALIVQALLREYDLDSRGRSALIVLACLTTVFLTPPWTGTDVFLWAALPYVVLLLRSGSAHPEWGTAGAGLLVGALYSIRYAAAFLVAAGIVLIAQTSLPRLRMLTRRLAMFGGGVAAGVLPTTVYLARVSERELPGYVQPVSAGDWAMTAHQLGVSMPAASIGLTGSPLLFKASEKIHASLLSYAIGLACLVALVLLPILTRRCLSRRGGAPRANLATSLALMPLTLALFLSVMTVLAPIDGQSLLGIARYYVPVSLCGVLVFAMLSRTSSSFSAALAGKAVIGLFLLYYCGYLPGASLLRHDGVAISRAVLGTTPPRSHRYLSTSVPLGFPSAEVYSVKSASRAMVERLHRRYPDAMFVVENYHHYVYGWTRPGAPAPGRDLRRFLQPHTSVRRGDEPRVPGAAVPTGLDFWRAAYVSRALRVFWVVNAPDAVDFLPSANRRLVFHDSFEHTTIFMSQFGPGEPIGRGLTPDYVAARSLP
jgi:hypothetical protein